MKSKEERHQEISESVNMVEAGFECLLDAFTGENTCPDCGAPIYQGRESDMNCPNCGVGLMFQGTTAISQTMLEEVEKQGKIQERQETIEKVGYVRAFLAETICWLRKKLWVLERKLRRID
jgi:uncharacterized Zn finger protein (UPF0148 family)